MRSRGLAGWLFLLVALAVPGLMFYNWWSHLNSDRKTEMTKKIRTRLPEGGIFAGPRESEKLENPISAQPAPPAQRAPETEGGEIQVEPAAASTGSAVMADASAKAPERGALEPSPAFAQPTPVSSAAAAAAADAPPPAAPAGQAGGSAKQDISEMFVGLRDPMISPYDYYILEQIELEKMLRSQTVQREIRAVKKKREAPIESRIKLQGIIGTDSGNQAIINDDVVTVGDMVGDQNHKARIVKITPSAVILEYQKRRFSIKINE